MLEAGADPNGTKRGVEWTPLWRAIQWGWPELIPFLLEAGADTALTDEQGRDALEWAIQCERMQAVQALVDPEGAAAAAARIPDPECDRIFSDFVVRLKQPGMKFRDWAQGAKHESHRSWEYHWVDGAWIEAEYDDSWPKSERPPTVVRVGADDQQLRQRIERTQRLASAINKPRRDAWRSMMEHVVRRGSDDLITG
jgi:ankyrin repeat protein